MLSSIGKYNMVYNTKVFEFRFSIQLLMRNTTEKGVKRKKLSNVYVQSVFNCCTRL